MKILIALFLTLTVLMAADACVAAMTAEEAYFAAIEQDDGWLVGYMARVAAPAPVE